MSVFVFDVLEPTIRCPHCEREFVAKINQKWMFSYTRCPHCKASLRSDFKTRVRVAFCGLVALGLLLAIMTDIVPFPGRSEPFTYRQIIWFSIGFLLLLLLVIMKKHSGWEVNEKHKPIYHDSSFYDDDPHSDTH